MTETTLREMAQAQAINEPGATLEEHLAYLSEVASELGLSDAPDTPLSEVDADTVLADAARQMAEIEDDDSDAAYDRVIEASLWA